MHFDRDRLGSRTNSNFAQRKSGRRPDTVALVKAIVTTQYAALFEMFIFTSLFAQYLNEITRNIVCCRIWD